MNLKSKVLPLAMLVLGSSLYASFSMATEIVNVPDEKLSICMNNYLHKKIPSSPITDTELATLTGSMTCAEMGVSDLTGAEYLVNITDFSIEDNQITSLEPLSGLTKLTRLLGDGNHITTGQPLKGLVNMQDLDLNNNAINGGDFISGMTSLESLNLSNNNIRTCPGIENLKNLKNLYLQGSKMTDITNFSGLTQLQQLELSGNGISDLSALSAMKSLTFLSVDSQDVQIDPVPNTGSLTLNDPVKNVDGSPIPVTSISNGGVYNDGQITWSTIPAGTDGVTFDFNQSISIDGLEVPFSGQVIQYLD